MLLAATNIASGACDDNWNQNPSEILRFSKNLDFWQFLKIDFELHICCHDYDLSNIINWQHIGEEPSARNFCRNFCFLTASQSNFHLWCRFFSCFDKINKFWQQKHQVLILSNKIPKVLICWLMLLRGPSSFLRNSKNEKWRFFENSEKSKIEQFFDNFWKRTLSSIYVAMNMT